MNEAVRNIGMRRAPADTRQAVLPHWLVLLVDDEPEIHEITKLVLSNTIFEGWPVEFHSAYSAAEAKAFLQQHPDTALVLLDVVMETEDAGLALVRHIRDQLNNSDVQIVLRTGQPGMAPEQDVILQFEINGYFLKTEITAQKLYSIVISSLRAFQYIRALRETERHAPVRGATPTRGLRQQGLESDLARAIERNELYVLAQPEVRLSSEAMVGIEILPSWRTGEGVLGASQLAGIARDPELRIRFDEWMVRQGCAWARTWSSLRSPPFSVSVPLLTEHIWDCQLLSLIERCLADFSLCTEVLDLEVPESVLLEKPSDTREALAFLQSKGVSITLVDFGSGMISLPLLYRLLPNRVKIHRSFVRNVSDDRERSAIARSIIALAHTLGLNVVADGIATERDLQFFKWEGCDVGQGDLLARSIGAAEVAGVLGASKATTH